MPRCKQDCAKERKICNEKTGRCVNRDGKIGKMITGKMDCAQDCERIGKVCNKATGNCIKAVYKKRASPPKPKVLPRADLADLLTLEYYFESVDVAILPIDSLRKFLSDWKAQINFSKKVIHWDDVVKAFKRSGKRFGINTKKFDETTIDFMALAVMREELKDKSVMF